MSGIQCTYCNRLQRRDTAGVGYTVYLLHRLQGVGCTVYLHHRVQGVGCTVYLHHRVQGVGCTVYLRHRLQGVGCTVYLRHRLQGRGTAGGTKTQRNVKRSSIIHGPGNICSHLYSVDIYEYRIK